MAKYPYLSLLLLAVRGVLSHEAHGTTLFPRAEAGPAFTYHGATGPLNWHGLSEANAICAHGKHQSPIDIPSDTCKITPGSQLSIDIPNQPHGAEFENLGTTVEVFTNGTLTNNGKVSKLAQFHFHTPSEHSVGGKYYPLEVHFVFQAEDATLSVVGFLIDVAKWGDRLLKAVAAGLPEIQNKGNVTHTDALDFDKLEKHFVEYGTHQYAGSLTTPPCSEGVSWMVSCKPLTIDIDSFNAFRDVIKFNARVAQNVPGEQNLITIAAGNL
ncbi:hypothetical protein OQA88_11654 [Cercophora sp. LCS_1]